MPTTLQQVLEGKKQAIASPDPVSIARERLRGQGPFAGHEGDVRISTEGSRLVLTGRLPSFYLKQVLQTMLAGLPGIARIDNRVDVIRCDGLSSEPPAPKNPASKRAEPLRRA